jgi:uncharacterized protein (TIGR02145 family)
MRRLVFIKVIFSILILTACEKEKPEPLDISTEIIITTQEATGVEYRSANISGILGDTYGRTVQDYGHCWDTLQNADINSNKTSFGSVNTAKTFTSNLKNLVPGKKYYARAYFVIDNDIVFSSSEIEFTTIAIGKPSVETDTILNITYNSAKCIGNVIDSNGDSVIAKGACWDTIQNPSLDTNSGFTLDGKGLGVYESDLTELYPGRYYYVRAYGTNKKGTSYGDEKSFISGITIPEITAKQITSITDTSAMGGGENINDGGGNILEKGLCWDVHENPSLDSCLNYTKEGTGNNSFNSEINGLHHTTPYYVRAYAKNENGTGYSKQATFTTKVGLPILSTVAASDITATTAKCGGEITDDGGADITQCGICWNITSNPKISNDTTNNETGTGSFINQLTELGLNTTYYFRAYATNSKGTAYGDEEYFTTKDGIPVLTTFEVTNITDTSATSGGDITDNGGYPLIACGVCWNTTGNPTINDDTTNNGNQIGSFTSQLTGLEPYTTYYTKAYATNTYTTGYGNEISFFEFICGISTVSDYDGNVYNTVQIGNQCWMKENLRVTKYDDGTPIPLVTDDTEWANLGDNNTDRAYCWYNNDETSYKDTYGALYTWAATMNGAASSDDNPSGVQGVCPSGWHLPSDAEWKELEMYLGMSPSEADNTGWRGTNEGSKLAGEVYLWLDGALKTDFQFGSSNFSALPGGHRHYSNGSFIDMGNSSFWWSCGEGGSSSVWLRRLGYSKASVERRSDLFKSRGFSVRCVRD